MCGAGYDMVKDLLGHNADTPANTPFWVKATSGLIAGAVGAALANPTDLIKVWCTVCSLGSAPHSTVPGAHAGAGTAVHWSAARRLLDLHH